MFKHWNSRHAWKSGLFFGLGLLVLYLIAVNFSSISASIQRFFSILSPFFIGIAVAYFLGRPTQQLEDWFKKRSSSFIHKRARGLAVAVVVLLLIAGAGILIRYVVPIIITSLVDFLAHLQQYIELFQEWIFSLQLGGLGDPSLPLGLEAPAPESFWAGLLTDPALENFFGALSIETLLSQLGSGFLSLMNGIIAATSQAIDIVLSLIFAIYMLLYKDSALQLCDWIGRIFIEERRLLPIKAYIRRSNEIFYSFMSAQFLDACILGTLSTILLAILNVQYAVMLGLLLGISNMIPKFGSIVATVITVVITILTGTMASGAAAGLQHGLVTGLWLTVLQQIDGNIIGPWIMGDVLGLNPAYVMLSILVGGAYFGILGMFVAVPVAAMLKLFFFDFLKMMEARKLTRDKIKIPQEGGS